MPKKNIETLMQVIDYEESLFRDNFYIFENKKLVKSIPLDSYIQIGAGDFMQIEMPDPIKLVHVSGKIVRIPQEEEEIFLPHPETVLELKHNYCPQANGYCIGETTILDMEHQGITLAGTIFFYLIKQEYFPESDIIKMKFPKQIRTKEPIRKIKD